jgi:hypothetical protein
VTLWGNQDTKFANETILYESEQVMVVNFKMFCNDPNMWTVEWGGSHLPNLNKMQFDYIHKSNGSYIYVGQVERLKIIKIVRGIAEMELVILKPNDTDAYRRNKEMSTSCSIYKLPSGKGGARYPCSTKKDVCRMRRWPLIKKEDLIKKVVILQDYGPNSYETW